MILYLIRHGQSANNLLAEQMKEEAEPFPYESYMKKRLAEPPLTAWGEKQAGLLGEMADNLAVDRIYCSPMLRTLQTARPLSQATGCPTSVWIDLHEHGGVFLRSGADAEAVGFPGLARSEMSELFPRYQLKGIGDGGWWQGGEEDRAACHARAVRVAEALHCMAIGSQKEEKVAAVSHGTFMDSLIKALLGRLPGNEFYVNHHNTGITRIDFGATGYDSSRVITLRYTNRASHLPDELLTF